MNKYMKHEAFSNDMLSLAQKVAVAKEHSPLEVCLANAFLRLVDDYVELQEDHAVAMALYNNQRDTLDQIKLFVEGVA